MKDQKNLQNSQKIAEVLWKKSSKLIKMAETLQFFCQNSRDFWQKFKKMLQKLKRWENIFKTQKNS